MTSRALFIVLAMLAGGYLTPVHLGPLPLGPANAMADEPAASTEHAMRTSRLIAQAVYNDQNEKIGTIEDILVSPTPGKEPLAILSVGQFLGGGDKLVAVPFSHVQLDHAKMSMAGATKAMLAKMPIYLFPPSSSSC